MYIYMYVLCVFVCAVCVYDVALCFFFLAVEKLVDALRCYSSPVISAEVFLTFRVMLLQLSRNHLVSLWPALLGELVSHWSLVMPALLTCVCGVMDVTKRMYM